MKLSELARAIGKSEKTLKKNFNRTKQTLEKQNIYIYKMGQGDETQYFLSYVPYECFEDDDDFEDFYEDPDEKKERYKIVNKE